METVQDVELRIIAEAMVVEERRRTLRIAEDALQASQERLTHLKAVEETQRILAPIVDMDVSNWSKRLREISENHHMNGGDEIAQGPAMELAKDIHPALEARSWSVPAKDEEQMLIPSFQLCGHDNRWSVTESDIRALFLASKVTRGAGFRFTFSLVGVSDDFMTHITVLDDEGLEVTATRRNGWSPREPEIAPLVSVVRKVMHIK